mmetsp:Transcript_43192/g.85540  ORF Transcript_43192/g.85540 Transcript_43192/m.85540 type:complete len:220 (+) Transcript_43192:1467-2126(+)
MCKSHFLRKFGAGPESNTRLVERSQVRSLRRPLHFPIAPNLLGLFFTLASVAQDRAPCQGVMPVDFRLCLVTQQNLFAALVIEEPLAEVRTRERIQSTLRLKLLGPVRDAVKIVQQMNLQCVRLVQVHTVDGFHRLHCILRFLVCDNHHAGSCVGTIFHWHVLAVFSMRLVDEPCYDSKEFIKLGLRNFRQATNQNGSREGLIHSRWFFQFIKVLSLAF